MRKSASKNPPLEKVPPETDSGIPKGEMTTEETVHRIRLDHKQGKKIKQIARLRRMDPKTVRKIVNSNEPRIEYNRKQIHYRELGPFKARLEELLSENIALKPKQRRKFVHLHGDLQAEGFRGSYDCVRRFCSKWMKTQDSASNPEETHASKAYTPLSFEPGEAFQFDWGSEVILLDGASTRVSVAHVTLAYSRMSFPRIYRRESLEMVLDAHEKAFTFFKGVCEFGIYDNMTTAVKKVLTGKDRLWNLSFEEYLTHQGVRPVACNRASGWEKGRVERKVGVCRDDFFIGEKRKGNEDLEAINQQLLNNAIEQARRRSHPEQQDKSIWEVFLEERKALLKHSDGSRTASVQQRSASKTCLVRFDRNHYSVHHSASAKAVDVHAFADHIEIFHHGRQVARHDRVFGRNETVFDYRHYLEVLHHKPGTARHGAPFRSQSMPDAFHQLWSVLRKRDRGDREFANILHLVIEHGEERIVEVCRQALKDGTASESVILNLLHRSLDPPPPEEWIDESLPTLIHSPSSDCGEYDLLLTGATLEPNENF